MAETDSRQQNQAFLQQLERQRLQKPCLRNIDLRGKVAGECQAYQIGNRTHYLDDRNYLLLKTLLERSNNQFTVAVYEAWQKALQLLMQQDAATADTEQKPILYRDSQHYQWLDFDNRIERREPRFNITIPAVIDADELRYHASTINISASAMRLSMRRVQHLQTEQNILISLPTLQLDAPADLLTEMSYRIIALEHTAQHTVAIVQRQREDDLARSQWFDNWLAERQQLSHTDLDSELFNLAHEYYLRLFCQHFSGPLFWCNAALDKVLFVHSSPAADTALAPWHQHNLLNQLPLTALANGQSLVVGITENGQLYYGDADKRTDIEVIVQLTNLQNLYLLRAKPINFVSEQVEAQLAPLTQRQPDIAGYLSDTIQQCEQMVTMTDITPVIVANTSSKDTTEASRQTNTVAPEMPEAQRLTLYINRQTERYEIHTPIVLHHQQQQAMTLTTNELSDGGLSVKLPVEQPLSTGSRVTVDFVRWQQQSKLKLTDIPYEVRSHQYWQGATLLGLRRLTENCPAPVNQFFEQVLAENKPTLAVRSDDLQLSLSSRLFAGQLSQQLPDILLFFALDTANNRILQSVAATANNAARQHDLLWQSLAAMTGRLTQPLKLPISDLQTSVSFGIYAFRRNAGADWQINSDLSFDDNTSKQLFIRRALTAAEQRFFSCHLQPIKTSDGAGAADLQQQLMQLRRHNSHKVKQIRDTLNSLFAIGQLTDVTEIIASQYR
ncbi:MAG TPA: PilZ domain-containing protein [Methylophaga sp.]|nr:PilZ domain-containing protein [Methylophaga sp.]